MTIIFIAIIEAFSKCLYLIAIASEADNVFSTIMLKVEHEFLLSIVECYTHIINYSFAKVVQIERKTKYFWIFLRCISKPCKTE